MKFRVSQGELWSRMYIVEAATLEEAKDAYTKYTQNLIALPHIFIYDPEYIDDIKDDVVWYDEEGNFLEGV